MENTQVFDRIVYLINEEPNKNGEIMSNSKFTIAQRMTSAIKKSYTLRNMLSKDQINKICNLTNHWNRKSRDKNVSDEIMLSSVINENNIVDFINHLECSADKLLLSLYLHLGNLDYSSVILDLHNLHIDGNDYKVCQELRKVIEESVKTSPRKYLIGVGEKYVSANFTIYSLKRIFTDNSGLIQPNKKMIVNYAEINKVLNKIAPKN